MTSSRPITFNDLITFMVFKPHLPFKPHAHKITIKIFNIKHGGSPRFWFFFAKSTVIWRYFYQVETCNHVDVKACWDFTHELRSTVKNKSWGRVFFICFVFLFFGSEHSHFTMPCELEGVLPGFLGIRFLRSRNAAPDCRASRRLSITPVSSPSGGKEKLELILEQLKLNYRKIKRKTPVRFT